jgi:CTP:molybdopterin cytidylyltransferase MocA
VHRHRNQTLYLDVDDEGILLDADNPEDYRRIRETVRPS